MIRTIVSMVFLACFTIALTGCTERKSAQYNAPKNGTPVDQAKGGTGNGTGTTVQ